jgi:3-hydroxyisobutyrate dehydrogenase
LLNAAVIDTVLARGDRAFGRRVEGRTLINMGTNPPSYSQALEAEIRAAGGRFVEAPVSGSRKPAEAGQVVAMLAGEPEVVESVRPLLAPICRDAIICGPVPNALSMKLAVNIFMITTVTGLAEAAHFAERQGLDLSKFVAIVNAAQMASEISRVKAAKLLANDFSKQAAISDCLENNRLIATTAREAGIASPLLDVCHALYGETQSLGFGDDDMISVIRAFEHRTVTLQNHS